MTSPQETKNKSLPWWTWVLPIILIHIGTEISLQLNYAHGVADHYLPTAISIILINWWGPLRVIPAMYINATISTGMWGIDNVSQWPIYAIPETMFTFLSWLLFTKLSKGKFWISDIKHLVLFTFLAILIPTIVEMGFLESLLVYFHEHSASDSLRYFIRNSFGDFISCFGLVLPVLYYGTPFMQRKGWLLYPPTEELRYRGALLKRISTQLGIIYVILLAMTFFVPFERLWFIYGFFSLYVALRYGFGPAIITNYYIFLITYLLPTLVRQLYIFPVQDTSDPINIYLGMLLLYIFAAVTGRVINDLHKVEISLQRKNEELEVANKELDRFVYSASHDLSAPLKSLLGLINISFKDPIGTQESYLGKMEMSVKKLEEFISEILDYSRNKRMEIISEPILLKDLCQDVIENLKFTDGFQTIKIDLTELKETTLTTDKSRLRIIINNLLSNAIKFRRKEVESWIKIFASVQANQTIVAIQDNGQGIRTELQPRIFEMFFRGAENSKGSGLGLYIAREAAERINGKITVKSEYGKGSTFFIHLQTTPAATFTKS